MKKANVLCLIVSSVLSIGILAACTPDAPQLPPVQPDAATAPATVAEVPPVQGDAAIVDARPVGRGISIAIDSETPTIAPGRHGSLHGHWKNQLTHNGLFRHTEDLVEVPDLVSEWRAISDTLFEFTIHEGIIFHNGEEMTAEDVVASFEFQRQFPEGAAQRTAVQSGEVTGRYTFTLYTGVPNALLLAELTHHANFIFPQSLIESGNDFNENPIGSGPFVFHDWQFGNFLTFNRFDNYFDTDRTARIEYVQWRIIPEGASRTIGLETGEIDFVTHVPSPDIPRLQDNDNVTVNIIPGTRLFYMLFNHTLPQFQDVYVRQVIDMAIDRDAIVSAAFNGWGEPLIQQFPPDFWGTSAEGTRGFDPDGARALMAAHGIDPSTIGFEMIAIQEEQRRTAEIVQANLADIGITTTVSQIDLAAWFGQTNAATHEVALSTFTTTNLLQFLRSTVHSASIGAMNWSHFVSSEFDELIDHAMATIDEDERFALLYHISTRANEEVIWVPTIMDITARAHNVNLIQPELSSSGNNYLNMVYWAE